jgi:hypothetical protein
VAIWAAVVVSCAATLGSPRWEIGSQMRCWSHSGRLQCKAGIEALIVVRNGLNRHSPLLQTRAALRADVDEGVPVR